MQIDNKTFIVTGGAGLIGSTIVDQLLANHRPRKIFVLDNLVRGTMLNLESALCSGIVEVVNLDIREHEAIRPYFDGVDGVFHQAAIRITQCASEPRECLEVLIDGTFNVLDAAVSAGVGKVVAASSASVYGMADSFPTTESHHPYNNRTWYGVAKTCNEGMLRSFYEMHELDYVALRYFNVYGPRMDVFGKYTEVLIRWLDCIDRGESPKVFGDGKQTMDFAFSEDIATVNLKAMLSEVTDEVFNVGSNTETSLSELLNELLVVTDSQHLRAEHLPERSVNSVPRRLADTTKAEHILGYRPSTSLREGLTKLVAWRREVLERDRMADYAGAPSPAVKSDV
jgi:UDP-glucose 4-epimerase